MPTKKKTSSKSKMITVGVLGRAAETYALTTNTTVKELATKLGINYTKAEVAKTVGGDFKSVIDTAVLNGFAAVLFTPQVDGGAE